MSCTSNTMLYFLCFPGFGGLVYVIGLHAVQFGNNLMKKEFFESNYIAVSKSYIVSAAIFPEFLRTVQFGIKFG